VLSELVEYLPLSIGEHHLWRIINFRSSQPALYKSAERFVAKFFGNLSRSDKILCTRHGIDYSRPDLPENYVPILLAYIESQKDGHPEPRVTRTSSGSS
jgi:hypothetical protein